MYAQFVSRYFELFEILFQRYSQKSENKNDLKSNLFIFLKNYRIFFTTKDLSAQNFYFKKPFSFFFQNKIIEKFTN